MAATPETKMKEYIISKAGLLPLKKRKLVMLTLREIGVKGSTAGDGIRYNLDKVTPAHTRAIFELVKALYKSNIDGYEIE